MSEFSCNSFVMCVVYLFPLANATGRQYTPNHEYVSVVP